MTLFETGRGPEEIGRAKGVPRSLRDRAAGACGPAQLADAGNNRDPGQTDPPHAEKHAAHFRHPYALARNGRKLFSPPQWAKRGRDRGS